MLYLSPPYYMIEGVVIAPDYEDRYQYYYFPNRPHLAVDNGRPVIRLLVYKEDLDELAPEEENTAGFLYFDTTLEWPEETLKKVAAKIQEDRDLDQAPRLSPLLYRSGTVRLIFLDRKTLAPGEKLPEGAPSEEEGGEPPTHKWVVALESSGVPSLYGDNRAIFSAVLTKQATQLIYDAFDGFIPAGVVYDLRFVGLQRAFNVHVTADWNRVYEHFRETLNVDLFVFSEQIDKMVDKLIEDKVIRFEATLEGVDEEGMENEFNAVRKELKEFVMDRFFKPAPNPDKQDPNPVADQIVDFARGLRNLGFPNAGYTRRELSITDIQKLDIDYTVTRAVERNIAPQAHIGVFFEDFGLTRDDLVKVVKGSDDFWKEVEFNVSANADFDTDGLFGVNVDVAYGRASTPSPVGEPQPTWSALLNKANPLFKRSAWFDPEAGRSFHYRYRAMFSPGATPGPELSLSSGWRPETGNVLVITPSELYQKRRIEFQMAKNFPYDLYPQAQVHIRYADPQSGWSYSDSELLDQEKPRAAFNFRSHPEATAEIEYRYSFVHSSGLEEGEWLKTESDLVLVTDPRPNLFRVSILVAGDRTKIQELLLDMSYEDLDNGVSESKPFRINQSNINEPFEWVFAPADRRNHRYSYSQTLLDTDGNMIATGWVQDDRPTLPVGSLYARKWQVQPELIGPPLADNDLEKIKLRLNYHDEANQVQSSKELVFNAPGRGESWPLELKDPSFREYSYEVIYVLQSGFERRVGPLTASDTFLIISSVPPL